MPQALWGAEVLALDPSSLEVARSGLAACSAVTGAQRSRLMAVVLSYGSDADPSVSVMVRTVRLWFEVWQKEVVPRSQLRIAWREALREIQPGGVGTTLQWGSVCGPVAATVAS